MFARFEVAMNQSALQRRFESLGDLDRHIQHLSFGEVALEIHEVVERALLDEFHREIKLPMIFAERENLHHVRVINRRRDLRLVLELGALFEVRAAFLLEDSSARSRGSAWRRSP